MKEEKNMKMKKVLKAMVAATACACMLTVPLNIHAAEPKDCLVVDGSLLTHEDSAEVTELFEWRFDNPESEVAPLGTYYATGHAGISKQSSKSVYVTATTDCYEKCDEVEAEVNLQRLEGSTWAYVTSRDKIRKNVGSVTVSDTISVKSGYYYRVVSFHSATKNGKTEVGSATSESLYVG